MLFYSMRRRAWISDPLCVHCKRNPATCGDPNVKYSCAWMIARPVVTTRKQKLPKKVRVREKKSRHKRGRASGRAVRRRHR